MNFFVQLWVQQTILVSLFSIGYGSTEAQIEKNAITEPHEGFRLNGDILKELTTVSFIMCTHRCLHHSRCRSTNVHVGNGKFPAVDICQLVADNLENKPGNLVKSYGWIYNDVKKKITCPTGYTVNGDECVATSSCKVIKKVLPTALSGVYWINLRDSPPENVVKLYCDMETDGGGWTLVYSYGFTNYASFYSRSNAVTPRPNWNAPSATVPISTNPPMEEYGRGALDFQKWKLIGREIMVKSNINHWIVCQPKMGSVVDWIDGSLNCTNIKNVATKCHGHAPVRFYLGRSTYGPAAIGGGGDRGFYFFDGDQGNQWPVHDPCGSDSGYQLAGIPNPGGNIFIR